MAEKRKTAIEIYFSRDELEALRLGVTTCLPFLAMNSGRRDSSEAVCKVLADTLSAQAKLEKLLGEEVR